jgi:hypothetical protein
MENIFIDTVIFRNEKFLIGARMKGLLRLCKEGHFRLILPKITVNEIKAQYKKVCKVAWDEHTHLMKDRKLDVLRNFSDGDTHLEKLPSFPKLASEFNDKLDAELADVEALILDYPIMDLSDLLDDYFNNRYPFNRGDKKHEFPDAIALKQLEKWCEDNKQTCIVLSTDKDLINFSSKHLDVRPDYSSYLDSYLKLINPKIMTCFYIIYKDSESSVDGEIKTWLDDTLNDSLTYDTNSFEIHDISINKAEILDREYQITGVVDDKIYLEIMVRIGIDVDLEVDDEDNSIYDSEDKVMIFLGTTHENIQDEIEVPIKAFLRIESEDDFEDEIEIEQINEGKSLELVADRWNLY